jgi:hypothetical protein
MFRNTCHSAYHKYHKQGKVGFTMNKAAVGQIFQQISTVHLSVIDVIEPQQTLSNQTLQSPVSI